MFVKNPLLKMLLYFNSIKVRLELTEMEAPIPNTIFQFHKGAIRTHHEMSVKGVLFNFNSIKVRLEHPCHE